MWDFICEIGSIILGWMGFGKPDPEAQGVASGVAQQTAQDALEELKDVQKADQARGAVDNSAAALLRDRNNTGPVSRR
jgi:hypothetical protein